MAALQLAGVWIIEWSELDSITRADVEKIKAFMSRTADRFRPPYEKDCRGNCRGNARFIGTSNKTEYLRDESGGRRFWPTSNAA